MNYFTWHESIAFALVSLVLLAESLHENACSSVVSGYYGTKVILSCNFKNGFEGVYWFEETEDITPFIKLESGLKAGPGYVSNEYDVLQDGSLVIINVQSKNEQRYKIILLDSNFQVEEFRVRFSGYYCLTQVTGHYGKEGILGCNFEPNFVAVYWFDRTNHIRPLIILESGQITGRTEEYDVLQNGSLFIKNIQFTHGQEYKVLLLDSQYHEATYLINLSVISGYYCSTQVTGHYGTECVLGCNFEPNFVGVYWYNITNHIRPLIRLERGQITGRIEEYDVLQNGSLVIKNIQFTHEQEYKVLLLDSQYHEATYLINLSVIGQYCPTHQSGLLGEESVIICHFQPHFRRVSWIDERSGNQILVQREGSSSTVSGPGFEMNKFSITNNGSLIIRRVVEENNTTYGVTLLDVNNNSSFHRVYFKTEILCVMLTPPKNGFVNQSAKLAKFSCKEGFHIDGSQHLTCNPNNYHWSGTIPGCVSNTVSTTTTTRTTATVTSIATDTTPSITKPNIYTTMTDDTIRESSGTTIKKSKRDRTTPEKEVSHNVSVTVKAGGSHGSEVRMSVGAVTLTVISSFIYCIISSET